MAKHLIKGMGLDAWTQLFKALSDRNRFRVVAGLLRYDELCACQITELLQVSGATTSRHMGVLRLSGLVESRKRGRWVFYRLVRERDSFRALVNWINEQLEHDPAVAKDAVHLAEIIACDPVELCRRQRGAVCCPEK